MKQQNYYQKSIHINPSSSHHSSHINYNIQTSSSIYNNKFHSQNYNQPHTNQYQTKINQSLSNTINQHNRPNQFHLNTSNHQNISQYQTYSKQQKINKQSYFFNQFSNYIHLPISNINIQQFESVCQNYNQDIIQTSSAQGLKIIKQQQIQQNKQSLPQPNQQNAAKNIHKIKQNKPSLPQQIAYSSIRKDDKISNKYRISQQISIVYLPQLNFSNIIKMKNPPSIFNKFDFTNSYQNNLSISRKQPKVQIKDDTNQNKDKSNIKLLNIAFLLKKQQIRNKRIEQIRQINEKLLTIHLLDKQTIQKNNKLIYSIQQNNKQKINQLRLQLQKYKQKIQKLQNILIQKQNIIYKIKQLNTIFLKQNNHLKSKIQQNINYIQYHTPQTIQSSNNLTKKHINTNSIGKVKKNKSNQLLPTISTNQCIQSTQNFQSKNNHKIHSHISVNDFKNTNNQASPQPNKLKSKRQEDKLGNSRSCEYLRTSLRQQTTRIQNSQKKGLFMDLIAFNINSTIDNNQSDNKNLINKTKFQYKIKNIQFK